MTIAQLPALKQRRQALALQQARYGISADPSITTELQHLETVIGLMERIGIHRKNLVHLLRQRDHYGAAVPPHVMTQIASERERIAELRAACARAGQPVELHPLDDEPFVDIDPEHPAAPLSPDLLARVREVLRDAEAQSITVLDTIRALRREIG